MPVLSFTLLISGLILLGLVILAGGSRTRDKHVKARTISGQVVLADTVQGGVHQIRRPASDPPGSSRVRTNFEWLRILLAIIASALTISGAIMTCGGVG